MSSFAMTWVMCFGTSELESCFSLGTEGATART